MQIGELARLTGCNIETIRYYERVGLLPKPARRGRYRRYEPADAARLGFVRRARELGFTLDEVRALMELASGDAETCANAQAIAADHLADVRRRIADLRRMERVLSGAVRACDDGRHTGCPLLESLGGAQTTLSARALGGSISSR